MGGWRCCAVVIGFGALVAGCAALEGGPERLYSVADEASRVRTLLDGPADSIGLLKQYDAAPIDQKMYYRNEIVAARMYLIDVEYSAYEAALTSDRQKFQFAGSVAAQGLNTAGALFTHADTIRILSGLAGAVSATKGYYDSDIVIAKTIQIAEGQMRAQRDTVAQRILSRRGDPVTTYPLSAAMSDLEDYYRAGTLNSGLIDAAAQSGIAAARAADGKTNVLAVKYSPITNLGTRILGYWRSSPAHRTSVGDWVEKNTDFGSVPVFLRSNSTALYQKMISDLGIP